VIPGVSRSASSTIDNCSSEITSRGLLGSFLLRLCKVPCVMKYCAIACKNSYRERLPIPNCLVTTEMPFQQGFLEPIARLVSSLARSPNWGGTRELGSKGRVRACFFFFLTATTSSHDHHSSPVCGRVFFFFFTATTSSHDYHSSPSQIS
jgi:hypothetical protein